MRRIVLAVFTLVLLAAWAPAASAKGPTSGQLTGPGVAAPIALTTELASVARLTGANALVVGLQSGAGELAPPPAARRGPEYRLRFYLDQDAGRQLVLDQRLYPFFPGGGAVVFTPSGQRTPFSQDVVPGGWTWADPGLTDALVTLGVPAPEAPSQDGPTRPWWPFAAAALVVAVLVAGAAAVGVRGQRGSRWSAVAGRPR